MIRYGFEVPDHWTEHEIEKFVTDRVDNLRRCCVASQDRCDTALDDAKQQVQTEMAALRAQIAVMKFRLHNAVEVV